MLLTAAPFFHQSFLLFYRLENISDNLYLNLEWFFSKSTNGTKFHVRLHAIPLSPVKPLDKFLYSCQAHQALSSPNINHPNLTVSLLNFLFTLNQTDTIFAGRAVCPLWVGWSEGREGWALRKSLIYQIHMSGAHRALCWALWNKKEEWTWLLFLRSQLCSWRKQIR